jgi:hypothetical protein
MKVVILSGIPGSGKSTYAASLGATICSADDYMIDWHGKYHFDAANLGRCHALCMRHFVNHCVTWKSSLIVVDNTNLAAAEISPYALVATAFDYSVEIHRIYCDPSVAFARQTHGVPKAAHDRMAAAFAKHDVMPWWNVVEVGK